MSSQHRVTPSRLQAIAGGWNDRDSVIYRLLIVGAIAFPIFATILTGGSGGAWITWGADAGVYVLLAIGLNIVVGYAGLLDLGYAAFFAIGAYTVGMLSSGQLYGSPLHHEIHLWFWPLLFVGMFAAAAFGALLGAPTLRLRGDYLAIVTLGFGEIVPRVFRYLGPGSILGNWTGGVNGIAGIDPPSLPFGITGPWDNGASFSFLPRFDFIDPLAFYVLMVILVIICVIAANNLYRSRLGRAWMAVREDEVAAAATGVNTVAIKLLAFAIGASFSGFAGTYYGAKLSLVSSENFAFAVSVTVLIMVVLGGMGNIPGVVLGAIGVYYVLFNLLPSLPEMATNAANAVGLGFLNASKGDWIGLHDEVQRLNFLVYGLILVLVMLLRPQGLLPSRIREQELAKGTSEEAVFDLRSEG
jgi:ABC-type branched-subunit amino acid transport system permease subunit